MWSQEPWLLDRQTMKYDEMLPTLVLDLDKADSRQCKHGLLASVQLQAGDTSPSSREQAGTSAVWLCYCSDLDSYSMMTLSPRAGKLSRDPSRTSSSRSLAVQKLPALDSCGVSA